MQQIYSDILVSEFTNPIPPLELSLSSPRLIVWADSPSKRPTWDLAIRLRQLVNYGELGWVETHYQRIFLGKKTLVNLPAVASPYLLRLEIPFWFPDMAIDVWEETPQAFIPVGFFLPYAGEPSTATFTAGQTRFLQLTGSIRSIGNPNSAADIAEDWLRLLFMHFWDRYPLRSEIHTAGGQYVARGPSALEDWEQNRRLIMPDFRGAALVGAGDTIGPGGILIGENEQSLAIANLPTHAHNGATAASAGSHGHTLSIDAAAAHAHTLSIDAAANHAHTLSIDAAGSHGHTLSIDAVGAHSHTAQVTGGPSNTATSGSAARLIFQNPGTVATDAAGSHGHTGSAAAAGSHGHTGSAAAAGSHGHTGSAAAAGSHGHTGSAAAAGSHTHPITIPSEGDNAPISVMQLSAVEHWFVSCGV